MKYPKFVKTEKDKRDWEKASNLVIDNDSWKEAERLVKENNQYIRENKKRKSIFG
jgi:hypothetical protein